MDTLSRMFTGIGEFLQSLTTVDYLVIGINLLLMIFARQLVKVLFRKSSSDRQLVYRTHILRALNLFVIISFSYYHVYSSEASHGIALKILSISILVYFSYLFIHVLEYIIRLKYGKTREVDGEKRVIETYNTRLLTLLASLFVSLLTLIAIIQILGFESMLQAGGVIGFIGVFFALTQSSWAPDIFSGLIILNSGMVEEGDVIEFNDVAYGLGIVFKTRMFHTEILNLVNNHRIMVKNARLREMTIHNLSKFASARGLREKLSFNIGYDDKPEHVREMFNAAFESAQEANEIAIEYQYPLEIRLEETGDYALEWSVFYYTKDVKNILKTRSGFREVIFRMSKERGIDLSTPLVVRQERGGEILSG